MAIPRVIPFFRHTTGHPDRNSRLRATSLNRDKQKQQAEKQHREKLPGMQRSATARVLALSSRKIRKAKGQYRGAAIPKTSETLQTILHCRS